MIYAKIETPEDQEHLDEELKASRDRNWYRRLQII